MAAHQLALFAPTSYADPRPAAERIRRRAIATLHALTPPEPPRIELPTAASSPAPVSDPTWWQHAQAA